jgi:hypothetical protein
LSEQFDLFPEDWMREEGYVITERSLLKLMRSGNCTQCGKSHRYGDVPRAPMLHNDVWLRIAFKHEVLCAFCFSNRLIERRFKLNSEHLRPCPLTEKWLFHHGGVGGLRGAGRATPPIGVAPDLIGDDE